MAGKQPKERVVSVEEGDGEVIDLGLFDFLKENREENEIEQPKPKPEDLVTAVKKIDRKNEKEIHELLYYSNDEDEEIEEETDIEEMNEKKNVSHGGRGKYEGEVIKIATLEDTSVKIERVTMGETMWEEKMEGSSEESKDKKGFLKRIIERWT